VSLVGLPDVAILDVEDIPGAALRVHVELTRSPQGCPRCGVVAHVKIRRRVELVDLSMGGRPMRVIWRKRRFRCPEPSCPVGSWTEDDPRIASKRLMMTDRAWSWFLPCPSPGRSEWKGNVAGYR
jgi:transposase